MSQLKPFKKKCISILIGNLLLAPVLTQAATITVNTTNDSTDVIAGQCNLRNAIDIINNPLNFSNVVSANNCVVDGVLGSNDQINFDLPEGSNTIILQGDELLISSTVSINGPGADLLTIDGNQTSRVMNLSGSDNSRIDGLTITGGGFVPDSPDSTGAGIFLANSNNTVLSNLEINNNVADYYNSGGGVSIVGSNGVTLDSVKVSNNVSNVGGGIAVILADNLTIVDSEISGNIADPDGVSSGAIGGGIQIIASGVTIENSTISDNTAIDGSGGGISIVTSNTVINRTTISNNLANTAGGLSVSGPDRVIAGIEDDIQGAGDTVITNSTISGNSAAETISYGYSYGGIGGGAVVSIGHSAFFNNVTITDNSSASEGGGIFIGGPALFPRFGGPIPTSVSFDNTVVADNTGDDCSVFSGLVEFNDNGSNWFGDDSCNGLPQGDPLLGLLSDNGGPTLTHAPLPNSGLIDAGSLNACQTLADGVDQRNEPRGDAACFIGAVETVTQEEPETLFFIPLENGRTVIFGL